ncbi:aminotransferase class I/II-fold pyridoxal phosphate-dependent enzyme [Nesterenkonia sp. MY13]|uniref:Aminotransferase class I/II-fold pyridoxal phosphate-dependent enzyme n=1 Tax=Nesterenkonia sedimenti TaxID=1463632 RepID=A0A7X8TL18_9MICC|nr:aminotransferase class I/II-fold pyridoxal phosphate-dependent enzyme [Nesterenkonia sedimenti]NLS10529.1 aminotransferase class I/II-fold pyridoxal phosphate-dependent enzyme [Nesterenkonia sedimenti]
MSTPPWKRSAAGANTFDEGSGAVLPTIYERTTGAAIAAGAMNLGQGFPDAEGPQWLRQAAADAVADEATGPNQQYPPGIGLPVFREAVAEHQRRHYGLQLDPASQVLFTTGATEGIAAIILAFAEADSEVLTFEPWYDSYGAIVALAGAQLTSLPLSAPDFRPDVDALIGQISEKTSMILLNTPHNPTGTVFTPAEMQKVIDAARAHGVVVMCDEVYEHLLFDGAEHTPILTLPGADEVAVAVSSVGKSFSLTGWKVGWVTGSPELVNRVRGVKQFLTFSSAPAYQWATAQGLVDDRGFFAEHRAQLTSTRDLLIEGLQSVGLTTSNPQAGYFVLADISPISDLPADEFCRRLNNEVGVAAIPVSSLTKQNEASAELDRLVRFAFCKHRSTVETALERLQADLPLK